MRSASPILSARRRRFAATASGSSPTWSPMLKVSNGADDAPPARVVVTRRIVKLTVASIAAQPASTFPGRFAPALRMNSVAHEGRHVDVVVVISAAAANAHRRPIGVDRHTRRVDRFEDRRGDLAGLARRNA